jgi:hypothetical protein
VDETQFASKIENENSFQVGGGDRTELPLLAMYFLNLY